MLVVVSGACRDVEGREACGQGACLKRMAFLLDSERISGPMKDAMNISLVKSAPQGDFVEISALMKDWEAKFQASLSQKKPIKYDMYPMPGIPKEFTGRLSQQGYQDLVLEYDRWQHFLIPDSD